MTQPPPSPGFRKLAAVLLAFGAVFGALVLIVLPVLDRLDDDRRRLEDLAGQAARYEALVSAQPALERLRAELRARWAARAGLWQEANHDLVAADFQSRMTTMVERSGGRIISSQMLPVAKENGFVRITVRIEFGLSVNALRDLTPADLASSPPKLMAQTWNNAVNSSTFAATVGIPQSAASQVRIYQRYFYLNNK